MGSRIAEMQLRVLWEETLARFRHVEVVGRPVRVRSNFVKGYAQLPVRVHPHGAGAGSELLPHELCPRAATRHIGEEHTASGEAECESVWGLTPRETFADETIESASKIDPLCISATHYADSSLNRFGGGKIGSRSGSRFQARRRSACSTGRRGWWDTSTGRRDVPLGRLPGDLDNP
jgi:hypothetical protein